MTTFWTKSIQVCYFYWTDFMAICEDLKELHGQLLYILKDQRYPNRKTKPNAYQEVYLGTSQHSDSGDSHGQVAAQRV